MNAVVGRIINMNLKYKEMINLAIFGSVYVNPNYRKWKATDQYERLGKLPSKPLEKYEKGHTKLDIEFLAKLPAQYVSLCSYKLRIDNRIVFFTRDELMILLKYYYVKNVYQDEYGQFYFISNIDYGGKERVYLFNPFRTTGGFIYCGILMNDRSFSNIRFVLADPNDIFTVTLDELRLLVTFDAINWLCLFNDMICLYYTNNAIGGDPAGIWPLVEVYFSGKFMLRNGRIYTVNPYTGTLIPSNKFDKDTCYMQEKEPMVSYLDSSVFTYAFLKEMKNSKIYVKNNPVEMANFLLRTPHSTKTDFLVHDSQKLNEIDALFRRQYRAARKSYKQ